jgi:hypothetical protein
MSTRIFGQRRGRKVHWDQAWQSYPGAVGGAPASWFVDVGAVEAAPVAGLPVRLDVEVGYAPGPQGLPAAEDLPYLGELDDAVRAAAERLGGAYIGRLATGGICRFTAALPAQPQHLPTLPNRGGQSPTVRAEYDPHWAYVRDHLAPDERQAQLMGDLLVVQVLREQGDTLQAAREVDHVAYFPDVEPAEAAATDLRADGFEAAVERDDEGEYVLTASRTDPVAPPALHELTWAVKESVERHGGTYDGWSCAVTTASA